MKYLKLFEQMEKEIISISNLENRIRGGEDIDIDEIIVKLPDNQVMTYDEYLDGGYNVKYSTPNHTKSPMDKEKKPVPKNMGSEKTKKKYWEK